MRACSASWSVSCATARSRSSSARMRSASAVTPSSHACSVVHHDGIEPRDQVAQRRRSSLVRAPYRSTHASRPARAAGAFRPRQPQRRAARRRRAALAATLEDGLERQHRCGHGLPFQPAYRAPTGEGRILDVVAQYGIPECARRRTRAARTSTRARAASAMGCRASALSRTARSVRR